MVEVVFYRTKTSGGRARTFRVRLDGRNVGTVRGSKRLTVAVEPGWHVVSVRAGHAGSRDLSVVLEDGHPTMVAIDVAVKEPGVGADPLSALVLSETHESNAVAAGRSSLMFGEETAATRWLLRAALFVLVLGLVLVQFNHLLGVVVGGIGAITVVVFVIGKLLYRGGRSGGG